MPLWSTRNNVGLTKEWTKATCNVTFVFHFVTFLEKCHICVSLCHIFRRKKHHFAKSQNISLPRRWKFMRLSLFGQEKSLGLCHHRYHQVLISVTIVTSWAIDCFASSKVQSQCTRVTFSFWFVFFHFVSYCSIFFIL